MKHVAAIIAILGLCAAVGADCRPVVRSHFVQPVHVAQFVPVAVAVPQYSVGLAPQIDLVPIVEELRLLRASVQALKAGEVGELPPEPEYIGIVRSQCAACHGIVPKGNKLSFFDQTGRFKEPTPEVLGTMIAAVASGSMPKGGKMDSADRLKLISGLTTQPERK